MTTPRKHAIWAAVAQHNNMDAGHVCYGRTKDEAREKARKRTTMSVAIRRELVSAEGISVLKAIGKL